MPFFNLNESEMQQALPFKVENIRFDVDDSGCVTIWFDLTGERFVELEAMTNMFIDFGDFMDDLKAHERVFHDLTQKSAHADDDQDKILERLDAAKINWSTSLNHYLIRQADLTAIETERIDWLHARRNRKQDTAWEALSAAAANPDPSWDEVANRLIDDMNNAVVALYPELANDVSVQNEQLREMLEFHMRRLTNELVGMVEQIRTA